MFFSYKTNISALYNAQAGTAYNGKSTSNCGNTKNCFFDNGEMSILQARLYYVDNGSFQQIGDTYYFVGPKGYNFWLIKGLNQNI